jgi:RHS repeat-associated protein
MITHRLHQLNSDLDDAFPRGASTAGGTGGSTAHSHSVTIETNGPSSISTAGGGLVNTATDTHTHSCSTTTGENTNEPPYIEMIYGQRKDPSPSASVGSEQAVTSGGDGVTYTYLYSGDGEMIAETIGLTTTIYIGNIYEKKDQGGTITEKKLYYAGSLRVAVSTKVGAGSWEVNFLLSDHLGSTSLMVDASGERVSEMRYSPWGGTRYTLGSQVTNYQFTGQRNESGIGLYFFQARFYDASLGRFVSPDTLIPDPMNVLDRDRYQYVRSNPLKYTDPSGHECFTSGSGERVCTDDSDSYDELPMPDPNADYKPPEEPKPDENYDWEYPGEFNPYCGLGCMEYVSYILSMNNLQYDDIWYVVYPGNACTYLSDAYVNVDLFHDHFASVYGTTVQDLELRPSSDLYLPPLTVIFYNQDLTNDNPDPGSGVTKIVDNHAAIVIGNFYDPRTQSVVPYVYDVNSGSPSPRPYYVVSAEVYEIEAMIIVIP